MTERALTPTGDRNALLPLVSVVIPAFNAASFITAAVRSALAQTIEAVEIRVVDDGSTDGTSPAVQAMADDDRVILRHQSNLGAAAARNTGWRAAAAPLIAFLDADDEWDPEKLEAQLHPFNACPDVVAVGSMMRYVSCDGRPLGTTGQPVGDAEQVLIRRGELFPFPMSSLVVRRDALERVGGFDAALGPRADDAFVGAEDLDLLARLAEVGRIACVPTPLGSYRIHASSAMATRRQRISLGSRFVRRRQAARHAGGDLSWEQFIAQGQRTWRERRQDVVEALYRHAAVSYADRRFARLAGGLMLAALVDAGYTVRRLLRQAGGRRQRENFR